MIERIITHHSYAMSRSQNSSSAEALSDIDEAPNFRVMRLPRIRRRIQGEQLSVFGRPRRSKPQAAPLPVPAPYRLKITAADIETGRDIILLPLRVGDEVLLKGRRGTVERLTSTRFFVRFQGENSSVGFYIAHYER